MGGADVDAVPWLALERGVAGEHVEVPEGEAGGEAGLLAQGDGFGELQEAEVGFAVGGAHADADEFDLGDEEAVAGVAFAHEAVEVGEAGEVEGLLAVFFLAEAGVPDLVGLDEADDAAAAEGVGLVVGVGGEVEGAVFFAALREHGDVVLVALADLEGGVDFGRVQRGDDVLQRAFVGGLQARLVAVGLRERRGGNGNVEQAGAFPAVREAGDRQDGVEAEVFPIFQVSDVPPAVHVVAEACGDLCDQCRCRVRSCQVLHNGGCWPVEAELGSQITILG